MEIPLNLVFLFANLVSRIYFYQARPHFRKFTHPFSSSGVTHMTLVDVWIYTRRTNVEHLLSFVDRDRFGRRVRTILYKSPDDISLPAELREETARGSY